MKNLGVLLESNDGLDRAVLMYKRAVEIDPTFIHAWCNLGINMLFFNTLHVEPTKKLLNQCRCHCQEQSGATRGSDLLQTCIGN